MGVSRLVRCAGSGSARAAPAGGFPPLPSLGQRDARVRVVDHGDRYGRDPAGPLPTSGTGKTDTSCRRTNGERFAALREKFPNWVAALNRNKCLALARRLLYAVLRDVALRELAEMHGKGPRMTT